MNSPLSLRERVGVRVKRFDRQLMITAQIDTRSAHGDNRENFTWRASVWQRVWT